MRCQGFSQEIHPPSNEKKAQSIALKEKAEKMPRIKGGSSNNNTIDTDNHHTHHGGIEPVNERNSQENGNQSLKNRWPGGDLLSQWRQKKRSRGCRTMVDDSVRKSIAIGMHVAKTVNQIASTHPHITFHSKDTISSPSARSPEAITRNSEDLPASGCNGLSFHQIADRHSPPSSEKPYRMAPHSGFTTGAVGDFMAPSCAMPSEIESFLQPAEKIDIDMVQWPKIFISLSRKEKEDDFFVIKGSKLPQRPKRRPKLVEKNLLNCYPGVWLSDVARGRYDVREKKNTRKKPRGLKAMESQESDSD